MPHFRRATPADAAAIRDITHRAYEKWVAVIGRLPKPMTADYAVALRDHEIELLEDEGGVVGLVEVIPAADDLLIENLAIEPIAQGRGHGRVLVAHVEVMARERGLSIVRLYTNKLFAANITFYAQLGYAIDREEEFRGGIIVHMSKRV